MFQGPFQESIIKRAQNNQLVTIELVNFREYSQDKHKRVDDIPYGGGAGMVLKPEPLFQAIRDIKNKSSFKTHVVLLTPQGRLFKQCVAQEISDSVQHLILVCGHYEGVDQRVRDSLIDDEWSIGDYVLTGGEIPAMVVVDAIVRLQPGVLGNPDTHQDESFYDGLLEYPHYTRPETFEGQSVPSVLLSGHHKQIEQWRSEQSIKRTKQWRPDLYEKWANENNGGEVKK